MLKRRPLAMPYEDQVPALRSMMANGGSLRVSDPARFVEAVLHHNLAGYAAVALDSGALELPRLERERLAISGAMRIARSAALRRELARIGPVVDQACATPPVCIKGPAAARFHPDPALRPFADLDLMVPRERLDSAVDALRGHGFRELQEFRPGFAARHGHDVHMTRGSGASTLDVEIHWRIGDDPAGVPLDHARLLATAERLEVEGAQIAAPAPPEHLLCLAIHLLSDRAKRLIWTQDITLAGRAADSGDWRRTFELADELGLSWVLHRALDYAAAHLGFERERPLPAGPPPPWGPLRAVEELDARAAPHVGRLAAMPWRQRPRYLRDVLIPTREGLRGTVGTDGAPTWRLVGRHLRRALDGLRRRD
jgi:putative nucleotidyltransferase-like protein